jgi:energy-coupling factor transporter transmembrane protein EcfT
VRDPRARIALLALGGVLALCLDSPRSLALLAAVAAASFVLARPGHKRLLTALALAVGVVWSTVLGQAIFYPEVPRTAIARLGPLPIYAEGVRHGLEQSLRFVAMALMGLALAASTPADRLFQALVGLRVPFGLALMVASAIRFLPELGLSLAIVRRARAHRGRPAYARAPWRWLLVEVSLFRPIVARAWRRAQNLAETLETRGFDPTASRRSRNPLRLGWGEALLVLVASAVTAAAVTARLLFVLYATDVAYFPELRRVYGFVRDWL